MKGSEIIAALNGIISTTCLKDLTPEDTAHMLWAGCVIIDSSWLQSLLNIVSNYSCQSCNVQTVLKRIL